MIQNLPAYQLPQPSYNAVKIDIHNPSVNGATCPMPMQVPTQQPQYAQPTAPYYNYPQAQLYDYPQAVQQPYYYPQQVPGYQVPAMPQTQMQPQPQVTQQCPPCNCQTPVVPAPQQININQAPQVANTPVVEPKAEAADTKPVDVTAPATPVMPQIDLNGFLARLADKDYEVQANAMEEIANMVKDNPQAATELLDAKIIDALVNITNADSSKLAGPTQEQIAIREKMLNGQKISDEEKALATTITPMEQAERNKSYAMFTTAILDKLYGEEVLKLTGNREQLIALPGALTMVDQLKDNPNPLVRASAIDALSYIQTPEYKKDLTTLFTIAKNDQDKGVQEAAGVALEKLNQI